jgi:DNA-binding MarR family transcriptional regulator
MAPTGSPTATRRQTGDAAIAARLRLSATRLARILRRTADTGLSPSQLSALATVEIHGPMTLGALAEHENVAPPSITKVVAILESQGLVSREAGANDRRVAMVSITRDGNHLLEESRRRKNQWLAERIGRLDTGQKARLAAALDVIETLTASPEQP